MPHPAQPGTPTQPGTQGTSLPPNPLAALSRPHPTLGAQAADATNLSGRVRHRQCTHYERAPILRRQSASATHACGGFAPTPPRFSALLPLPIGSFTGQIAEGGRSSIPLYRSRPLSRRSGCFPAWPYPPLSSALIALRLRKAGVFAADSGSMTLDLGGSGPSEESLSPQGGTQHAE